MRYKKLLTFVVVTLLMAILYFVIWYSRPDYFRVQQDVNVLPIDLIRIAQQYNEYLNDQALPRFLFSQDSVVVSQLAKLFDDIRTLAAEIAKKQTELDDISKKIEEGDPAFFQSQWRQFDQFMKQRIGPLEADVTAKDAEMEQFLTSRGAASDQDLLQADQVSYSKMRVERAELNVRLAQARVNAYDAALSDLRQFQTTPEQQAHAAMISKQRELQSELSTIRSKSAPHNRKLYDLLIEYRNEALARLTLIDFIYFSVGAATTASFGDISPNHPIIRLFVCLQVLFSVLLVGMVVNDLTNQSKRA